MKNNKKYVATVNSVHISRVCHYNLRLVYFYPIPTGCCHVTLIYGLIPPMAGRNRVKRMNKTHYPGQHLYSGLQVLFNFGENPGDHKLLLRFTDL